MARARNIKPSFFKNELLGEADPLLGLLFISLWTLADKAGRLEDRPLRIKAETFPYRENININGYLTELVALGFIERYKVGETSVIEVINFSKHQTPHSTEKQSELPCKSIDTPITLNNASASVIGHINVLNPDSLLLNPDSLMPDTSILIPEISAEKTSAPNKKGKSLDKDWQLPKQWGDWAMLEKPELSADAVRKIAENFKDHWCANANQANAKKADWEAAWRNWVRRQRPESTGFQTATERRAANNKRAGDEFILGSEIIIEGDFYHAGH